MLIPACDIYFVVGEPSGDAYAAAIAESLRRMNPNIRLAAAGCSRLKQAGVEVDIDMEGKAVMGFLPVLTRFVEFVDLYNDVVETIIGRQSAVVVTVDYPGFNLQLVKTLRRRVGAEMRFVHVVAPQIWAWKPRRAKGIAQLLDRLLCLFPFEPPLFNRHGGRAEFVGHPLLDMMLPRADFAELDRLMEVDAGTQVLLLAPGSREKEVEHLLPIMDAAARVLLGHLRRQGRRVTAVIAKTPELSRNLYRRHSDLPLLEGAYRDLCRRAHVGFITSGTACLEAAILDLPHVIAYRADHGTVTLARHLIRCEHIGLPNIVSGRRICPELIQEELTPSRLAAHGLRLWEGSRRERMLGDLAVMRSRLGLTGAIERMAMAIYEEYQAFMEA